MTLKVKPNVRALEDIWKSKGMTPTFVNTTIDEGEWSASRHYGFSTREIALGTYCIGIWVEHRGSLDTVETRKILPLVGYRIVDVQPIPILTELTRRFYCLVQTGHKADSPISGTTRLRTRPKYQELYSRQQDQF